MDVISEGWMGIHQADDIINAFHLEDFVSNGGNEWEALDEKWDVIDDFSSCLSELITQVMHDKYGMKGEYYFSSLDGDYALIYSEEVE